LLKNILAYGLWFGEVPKDQGLRYGTHVSLLNGMKMFSYITEIDRDCLQKYFENQPCEIEEISREGIKNLTMFTIVPRDTPLL